jgi:hypothetical protein
MKIERFNESENRKRNHTEKWVSYTLGGTRKDDGYSIWSFMTADSLNECLNYYESKFDIIKRICKDIYIEKNETIHKLNICMKMMKNFRCI